MKTTPYYLSLTLVLLCIPPPSLWGTEARRIYIDSLNTEALRSASGRVIGGANQDGHPLAIAGKAYVHGFGLAAPGAMDLSLDGNASRFYAEVGVDWEFGYVYQPTGGAAKVRFKLLADGVEVFDSGPMVGRTPARVIDIDVRGMKRLLLTVENDGGTWAHRGVVGNASVEVAPGAAPTLTPYANGNGYVEPAPVEPDYSAIPVLTTLGTKGGPYETYAAKATPSETHGADVSLASLKGSGVLEVPPETSSGPLGVVHTRQIELPDFERAVYWGLYTPGAFPNRLNRMRPHGFKNTPAHIGALPDGGNFVLFELAPNDYIALAAAAGEYVESWFHATATGDLCVSSGTYSPGEAIPKASVPLFAWARGGDLYEVFSEVVLTAFEARQGVGKVVLRKDRPMPDIYEYLGWNSWLAMNTGVSESKFIDEGLKLIGEANASKDMRIRWAMVDDFYQESEHDALINFPPAPDRFTDGSFDRTKTAAAANGIADLGLWHAALGQHSGISTQHTFPDSLSRHFEPFNKNLTLKDTDAAAKEWFDALAGYSSKAGFTAIKVDFMGEVLSRYQRAEPAIGNIVKRGGRMFRSLEAASEKEGLALLLCNFHSPVFFLNSSSSTVGRVSGDYVVGATTMNNFHVQNYGNAMWFGQVAWPDFDMFHSSDPRYAQQSAISRSLSGGAVYLSDKAEDFLAETTRPMIWSDGKIIRPLAPAVPLPESLFADMAIVRNAPYRVIAPHANGAATVATYLWQIGNDPTRIFPVKTSIFPADYRHASAMIQPYPGKWKIPEDGLFVYDWHLREGGLLGDGYDFFSKGQTDRLFHLCPIDQGWAVVGRVDKYLSPGTYTVESINEKKLVLNLIESGPIAVYSAQGTPEVAGINVTRRGRGLFILNFPVVSSASIVTITLAEG